VTVCPKGNKAEGTEFRVTVCPKGNKAEGTEFRVTVCPKGNKAEGVGAEFAERTENPETTIIEHG